MLSIYVAREQQSMESRKYCERFGLQPIPRQSGIPIPSLMRTVGWRGLLCTGKSSPSIFDNLKQPLAQRTRGIGQGRNPPQVGGHVVHFLQPEQSSTQTAKAMEHLLTLIITNLMIASVYQEQPVLPDNLKRRKSWNRSVLRSKRGQNPPNCPRADKAQPIGGQRM